MIKFTEMAGTFTAEECRDIVRRAVMTGAMSYPGDGTEPPKPEPWESATVKRARAAGMSVEEYLSKERVKDRKRRAERIAYRKKCLEVE